MRAARKAAAIPAAGGWEPAGQWFYDQALLDERMAGVYERFGRDLPTEVLVTWELEHHGGKCPVCGIPWKAVRVNPVARAQDEAGVSHIVREFADFTIHEPACRCFKRCTTAGVMVPLFTKEGERRVLARIPGCGSWLVAERLLTDHGQRQATCLNCGCLIV